MNDKERSRKTEVIRTIKEMVNDCFGYVPKSQILEDTALEIFYSFSPMLENKNTGIPKGLITRRFKIY